MECASIQLSAWALAAMRERARRDTLRLFANATQITSADTNRVPILVEAAESMQCAESQLFNSCFQAIEGNYLRASRNGTVDHSFDSELSRRRMGLYFYLIRSPLFDR